MSGDVLCRICASTSTHAFLVVAVLLLQPISAVALHGEGSDGAGSGDSTMQGYSSHAPITIDSNAEFASQASTEGWSGRGTQSEPYVIEGYEINASGSYRCISIGFPLLTVGILTGSIWLKTVQGGYIDWQDGRQTASLLIWFLYAGLLHGRLMAGWRGRRVAWMNVIGFLVILVTFLQLSHFQK